MAEHGTYARYVTSPGCRCDDCRDAAAAYQRAYRAAKPHVLAEDRRQLTAYKHAMRRLRLRHRAEFEALYAEEKRKR